MSAGEIDEFEIDVEGVARYFYWGQVLLVFVVGLMFLGIGAIAAPFWAWLVASWLAPRQAAELSYALNGSTLHVRSGVYFLSRKAIPLDQITDVVLVQGPLMRWCGIWALKVQTAGMGQGQAEATLYGIRDPEAVRDRLVESRAAGRRS